MENRAGMCDSVERNTRNGCKMREWVKCRTADEELGGEEDCGRCADNLRLARSPSVCVCVCEVSVWMRKDK